MVSLIHHALGIWRRPARGHDNVEYLPQSPTPIHSSLIRHDPGLHCRPWQRSGFLTPIFSPGRQYLSPAWKLQEKRAFSSCDTCPVHTRLKHESQLHRRGAPTFPQGPRPHHTPLVNAEWAQKPAASSKA